MQIKQSLLRRHSLSYIGGEDYSEAAIQRKKKLDLVDELVSDGCSNEIAFNAAELSRSTYYRWKRNHQAHGLDGLECKSRRPCTIRKPLWDESIENKVRPAAFHTGKFNAYSKATPSDFLQERKVQSRVI